MSQRETQQIVEWPDVERELAALRRRASDLEREVEQCQRLATLGTLSASIAHEFNNLLTPIVSYAQMALHSPEDAELVAKALRKAIEGSEKASGIASSMLGFIREDEGGCVHVAHAARDALACLARDPAKDGIRLEVEVGPECWVRMRPVALEQVLLNLILNAREAMRPGGGRLRIEGACSTWNHPPHLPTPSGSGGSSPGGGADEGAESSAEPPLEDDLVEIRIIDTGCGMAPELAARVFEPFVRDRHRRPGSTGLGLAICKRLVEEAGGEIEVESEEGSGTAFTIRLWRADPGAIEEGSDVGDAGRAGEAA